MNPGRFFVPNTGMNMTPMIGANFLSSRNRLGLFGRLTNSFRTFNWSNLLNSANKTLNVVNQTIPLVRQAGPMFNNMKSMLRIAKVFGNETTINRSNNKNTINNNLNHSNKTVISTNVQENNLIQKKEVLDNNYPNFFV